MFIVEKQKQNETQNNYFRKWYSKIDGKLEVSRHRVLMSGVRY